ncbi:MAG: hypothetical protein ABJA90_09415 [Ginsengibacter sp.]
MKIKSAILYSLILFIASCKKSDNNSNPPSQPDAYYNTAAGSTWNYHEVDNSGSTAPTDYTVTSTSQDSLINGKTYHVFNNSAGVNQYLNLSGHDYYQFDSLPAGLGTAAIERLYLKDNINIGINWGQDLSVIIPGFPLPIPFTITNHVAEKDVTRTVGAATYSNVIHVSTTIASSLIPAASLVTDINSYYAPKYGLIENSSVVHLNFAGVVQDLDTETTLVSATLK